MTDFKPKETLTEQVAQHLEMQIVTGQLHSGERILESQMAKKLNVSHGSVREALLLLEKRYLVRSVARKGTFVTELDATFVRGLYETLWLILSHTSRKLVANWTDEDMARMEGLYDQMRDCQQRNDLVSFLNLGVEYTQASLAYADNPFLVTLIQDLWPSARRCSFLALRQGNDIIEDNLRYMRDSLDAIRAHDEARLLEILERYAHQQCEQVLACIEQDARRGSSSS
ncbi:MAG: GntR family transcriptional regulator [Gammaproteobacteria bacterium]|nr:MAG: GntR family transcriptional regulator [Gammaproteobacteria bacterium]